MNKRLIKKKLKQSAIKLNKVNPKENEVIAITLEYPKYSVKEMQQIYDGLHKIFTKNKIVILPQGMKLNSIDKEKIIQVIQDL